MKFLAPDTISQIAEGLVRDNLTDAQIHGILGEHWLRLAQWAWK